MEYFFSDFTEANYARLLDIAKSRWPLLPIKDFDARKPGVCVWRHDVDVSPQRALALARIEKAAGVRATYYIMLRSEFYNVLERPVHDALAAIRDLGHEIGLHFSPANYDGLTPGSRTFETHLAYERDILSRELDITVESFSFHNPSEGGWIELKSEKIGGLRNAYWSELTGMNYCSDSNGYWRFRRLEEALNDPSHQGMYVLTHPEWWTTDELDPDQRIARAIEGRAAASRNSWEKFLIDAKRQVKFR